MSSLIMEALSWLVLISVVGFVSILIMYVDHLFGFKCSGLNGPFRLPGPPLALPNLPVPASMAPNLPVLNLSY